MTEAVKEADKDAAKPSLVESLGLLEFGGAFGNLGLMVGDPVLE